MRRRRLLGATGAALAAGLAGCTGDGGDGSDGGGSDGDGSDGGATPTPTDGGGAVSLSITNVGASAWEVTEDSSGAVAPTGEENPTLTLQVGTRYTVENGGWSAHPFALRGSDDTPLLSQSADGEFEGDEAVNWVDEETTLSFTMTESLASAVDYYVCTVHGSMRGDVTTE